MRSDNTYRTPAIPLRMRCRECGRIFDLTDETDASEWAYGHDCETDYDPRIDRSDPV